MPAPRASGRSNGPTSLASTPKPPANANAKGRNPAARRACEIETRSASDVKRNGSSITAKTASDPPTTYAAHRRRAAKPGQRNEEQRRDRDRTGSGEHLGREVVRGVGVDDELASVLLECAPKLVGVGRHRARVVHDRTKPEQEERGRDDERDERERPVAQVLSLPQSARREEADERDPEEDRVGRMDDGESQTRRGRRCDQPHRWRTHRLECQRERGRHEELARRSGRKREEHVRAAEAGREADHRDLRAGRDARRPGPAEERPAGLERDHDGERRQDRREVDDDALGILARDLRNQRDEAVPEREGVAGMETAVCELRHAVEREGIEAQKLPCAGEVKQSVALNRRSSDPDQQPDHRAPEERPCPAGHRLRGSPPALDPHGAGGQHDDDEEHERQGQRRAEGESDRERSEDGDERPGKRRRDAADAERARQQPAGREHDRSRERELEVEDDHGLDATSSATSPEASHAAPSR